MNCPYFADIYECATMRHEMGDLGGRIAMSHLVPKMNPHSHLLNAYLGWYWPFEAPQS
jgi:hypothetical protein